MKSIRPAKTGGVDWIGHVPGKGLSRQESEESFEMMHGVEVEKSFMMQDLVETKADDGRSGRVMKQDVDEETRDES